MSIAELESTSDISQVAEGSQLSVFSKDGFELLQRMANAFSTSSLVPKHYQGKQGLANCVIALNMAQRIGSDPLMTMQNLYVVHGTPAWSSQFLIATFNTCGRFSSIRYEWSGEEGKDDWGCRAVATELKTGETLKGSKITIALAKAEGWYSKSGSKWKTMPEQMLQYRAAGWFVRANAPEIAMGLHSVDEVEDAYNPRLNGSGEVISGSNRTEQLRQKLAGSQSESPLQPEEEKQPVAPSGDLLSEQDVKQQTTSPEDE